MTLMGVTLGGTLTMRYGVMKMLFTGAIATAMTNALFAVMSLVGNNVYWLALVVSADNLAAGIATSAFIAWMSSLTNVQYSATQYALFSSMMLLLPKFIAGFSGVMVDAVGYNYFFIFCALLGIPVLVLIWMASRFLETSQTL